MDIFHAVNLIKTFSGCNLLILQILEENTFKIWHNLKSPLTSMMHQSVFFEIFWNSP